MKFTLMMGFIIALSLGADTFLIKAHFPPKSAKRQSRLILSGTLPPLREVTVCHWVNAHSSNPKGMYIASYAHGKAADELLTGIVPTNQSRSTTMKLMMAIRNTTTQVALASSFQIGKWHHLCFMWSSGSGRSEAYLDGVFLDSASTPHAGQEIREGGVLMIGQEQDIYNGKFDPDEAWDGFISEVHIWDEKLTKKQISSLYKCGKLEGNVFAWMRSPLTAEDGVTLSGTNLCNE